VGGPLRVGVVGAGKISAAYLRTLERLDNVAVTAVADLDRARAEAALPLAPAARACLPDELFRARDVDAVLNLTVPAAHAEVALAAIAAGMHVYGEKPLAAGTAAARGLLDAAARAGVRIGCAPDTVLGTGLQTARALLDDGAIGRPVAATAFMVTPGHELWHPDPEFYYRPGGGPLFDMGPYHLTALVQLLGPVRRVTGFAATPHGTRSIASGPRAGTAFPVEVATHVSGLLEHADGVISTLLLSFDVWAGRLPHIEVYGSRGTLGVPDPNDFDGPVELYSAETRQWRQVPEAGGYRDGARGYGLAELAQALAQGRPHRADAELAFHVLEVMEALMTAAGEGRAVEVESSCHRPAPVPLGSRPDR
jgi:predicted dehydrogenase